MKKKSDTEPGQAVKIGPRRARKVIEAAIGRRSGQTLLEIMRDLNAQIDSVEPREIKKACGFDEEYPDFWFDDVLVAGESYENISRARWNRLRRGASGQGPRMIKGLVAAAPVPGN